VKNRKLTKTPKMRSNALKILKKLPSKKVPVHENGGKNALFIANYLT
jgi:hypothetical protein